MKKTPLARFWEQFDQRGLNECWPWTSSVSSAGYGKLSVEGRRQLAHRFAYELWVGPIPDGLMVDHTCHNGSGCAGGASCLHRRCVNPLHLEAVTHLENVLRGESPAAKNSNKPRCVHGHVFDEQNTYIRRDGGRVCRRCQAGREARRRAQIRGAA